MFICVWSVLQVRFYFHLLIVSSKPKKDMISLKHFLLSEGLTGCFSLTLSHLEVKSYPLHHHRSTIYYILIQGLYVAELFFILGISKIMPIIYEKETQETRLYYVRVI